MPQDSNQLRVFSDGNIHIAPFTPTLAYPTSPTAALAAPWVDIGYASEDGVTFTAGANVEDIMVWQKATPARRLTTAREVTAQTQLAQYSLDAVATGFGGGTWTTTGTGATAVHRYLPPRDRDPLAEYGLVLTGKDGKITYRLIMYRVTVSDSVETQWVRSGLSVIPITFGALTPDNKEQSWEFITDDPAAAKAA